MTLIDEVIALFDQKSIPCAVIGAAALAVHGISRSTVDQDLLVTDISVLAAEFWKTIESTATIDIRRGDATDPLAGVVRLQRTGDRPVDVIVGRSRWQEAVLDRAERVKAVGRDMPVVRAADLVLLKLYAGGSQDRWDIEQLLGIDVDGSVHAEVDSRIGELPPSCAAMWKALRQS